MLGRAGLVAAKAAHQEKEEEERQLPQRSQSHTFTIQRGGAILLTLKFFA
jgi:hypothetical protein